MLLGGGKTLPGIRRRRDDSTLTEIIGDGKDNLRLREDTNSAVPLLHSFNQRSVGIGI